MSVQIYEVDLIAILDAIDNKRNTPTIWAELTDRQCELLVYMANQSRYIYTSWQKIGSGSYAPLFFLGEEGYEVLAKYAEKLRRRSASSKDQP